MSLIAAIGSVPHCRDLRQAALFRTLCLCAASISASVGGGAAMVCKRARQGSVNVLVNDKVKCSRDSTCPASLSPYA